MPDLDNHYFLAMRTSADVSEEGELDTSIKRDKNTGLLAGDSFSDMAAEKLKAAKAGKGEAELTLINLPGFNDFYGSLDEDDQDILMSTVGTTLRANSLGGDSAGEIGEGKFGIIHDSEVNVGDLEAKLTEATRVFDPQGKGVEAQAGIRLQATNIVERWGMDLTGQSMFEAPLPMNKSEMLTNVRQRIGQPCGLRSVNKTRTTSGRAIAVETFGLPLGMPSGKPPRMVNYTYIMGAMGEGEHSEKVAEYEVQAWIDIGAGTPPGKPLKPMTPP